MYHERTGRFLDTTCVAALVEVSYSG